MGSRKKGEKVVGYSNILLELVTKLECVGHMVYSAEKKRALLLGLSPVLELTAENIMRMPHSYEQDVLHLIVRKEPIQEEQDPTDETLVTNAGTEGESGKCSTVAGETT